MNEENIFLSEYVSLNVIKILNVLKKNLYYMFYFRSNYLTSICLQKKNVIIV